jgi:hypothetical protein
MTRAGSSQRPQRAPALPAVPASWGSCPVTTVVGILLVGYYLGLEHGRASSQPGS